jgi:hypothetical protein
MEVFVTHNNSNGLTSAESTVNYDIPYELVGFDALPLQDTIMASQDSVPPKPTFQQIRYWRWLREKKLLVGGSRYIQPKKEIKLISSIKPESSRLGLPIHEINHVNTDWITGLLLLVAILLATVRVSYSKYIGYLFQSLINYSTSFRMFREKNYTILHGAFRLDVIFYLTFSLFLFQAFNYFQLELIHEKLTYYVVSLGMVIIYFLVKKISYRVLGSIFEGTSETSEYLFNIDIYSRSLGLVLFPIAALINYYPTNNRVFIMFTGVFIIGTFYIFLVQRGIYILLRKQFSIFYTFLYLCTLEFLPLLLIYKVVVL